MILSNGNNKSRGGSGGYEHHTPDSRRTATQTLNFEGLRDTVTAPLTLGHKVGKSQVPLVSLAPLQMYVTYKLKS